ncbi:MAG: c-type cytochrome, partial [Acidobacteriota bacterium]
TGQGGAQWGLTQDNDGKMWFQGGASGLPSYFQFPIVYGNFAPPNTEQMAPELGITWGAPIRLADMQGGSPAVRMPDGSLIGTTAGAGGDIFRGDRLPKDLIGDYTYGEVVARVVRRVHPENREGLTVIHNAYPNSEFIKSFDPLFRPVDQATGPDGTLYIVDMYQGIIQQGTWTPRGTYLRAKIEQYDLDKVIDRGRVWRLTYDGIPRDRARPRMYQETAAQLVAHLNHPNGWWRDTAQQTLVLRQDKSIVPALTRIVKTSPNVLGRFHALWTLEGLGSLTPALLREVMKDPEPRMRIQAIRASETLYKAGDRSFANDYRAFTKDTSVDVVIQAMLTMNKWKVPDANVAVKTAMDAHRERGIQFVGNLILNPASRGPVAGGAGAVVRAPFSAAEQAVIDRGNQIYDEVCAVCHGTDAMGTPRPGSEAQGLKMAPPFAGSLRVTGHRDYAISAVLGGVTGPVDDTSYLDVMIPMMAQDDEWIAAVTSYIRNSFGNDAPFVSAADVARRRPTVATRKGAWTVEELVGSLPVQLVNDGGWKATASHNPSTAPGGLTLTSWNSGVPQQPGMWYQVEMSKPATIVELQFESSGTGIYEVVNTIARAAVGAANRAEASRAPVGPLQFPRGYQVQVSMDGTTWSAPVAQGQGTGGHTVITFAPVQAKFVRITETATLDTPVNWAIQGLRIYQPGRL